MIAHVSQTKADPINHPPHYRGANGIEAIDVVEGFGLNFNLGNAVTYILRAERKGDVLNDLKKARWYLDREIRRREGPGPPQLKALEDYGLCYLATPYTRYPEGIDSALAAAAALAGGLLRLGIKIYSPIVHGHPIARYSDLNPHNERLWSPLNHAMMERSDILIVGKLSGYERSEGVAHEIAWFKEADKPICYLDPETLQVTEQSE